MNLGSLGSHPHDVIARHTARNTTADALIDHFERIIAGEESMAHRFGALQVLCSQAIARVDLLERQRPGGNVVPLPRPKPKGAA